MGQINARDWVVEVSADPDNVTPAWAEVGGLTSFTLGNSEGEESVDTTTFQSNGHAESQAMQRGASLSLEGRLIKDGATKDPGQAVVDDMALEVGDASLFGVRFRHISDTEWTKWNAWASKGDNAGGNNDKVSWSATLTRSGAAETVAVV